MPIRASRTSGSRRVWLTVEKVDFAKLRFFAVIFFGKMEIRADFWFLSKVDMEWGPRVHCL